MSGKGIPGCSRGLEPMPEARDGGRVNVQSNGCHSWRVYGRQTSKGPLHSVAVSLGIVVFRIWEQLVSVRALHFIAEAC